MVYPDGTLQTPNEPYLERKERVVAGSIWVRPFTALAERIEEVTNHAGTTRSLFKVMKAALAVADTKGPARGKAVRQLIEVIENLRDDALASTENLSVAVVALKKEWDSEPAEEIDLSVEVLECAR